MMNTYLYIWLKEPWSGLTSIGFYVDVPAIYSHMLTTLKGKYNSLIIGETEGVFEEIAPQEDFKIMKWPDFVRHADHKLEASD
jgi:hypothetical protein